MCVCIYKFVRENLKTEPFCLFVFEVTASDQPNRAVILGTWRLRLGCACAYFQGKHVAARVFVLKGAVRIERIAAVRISVRILER